ncbi:polysaccharide deacetylase family protein [Algoriphagus mannitolivorans]|uniref:polysaccharide deacetylase family protein n=1 Tax=Algoriphagus mannitolivorans TaxID=226504 RepID=UPI0004082F84|nr:polysaccharide deacetylase family protein [Algoriphagus mannitolivorans]
MIFHSVPKAVQVLFPNRKWSGDPSGNKVYLTFDDGPVPGVTTYVLEQLKIRNQKATFFMVGDNVRKHPELARAVLADGHLIGNHTYHHLKGFKTSKEEYYRDFQKSEDIFREVLGIESRLFRPPYGSLTMAQSSPIRRSHQIIMWDVLSGDYHPKADPEKILFETKKRTKAGSIIVFHDQQKTADMLPKILPQFLDFLLEKEFKTSLL